MAKILIIGAGVIGSLYGGLLARKGNDVTFLARKNRLTELTKHGLILKWVKSGKEEKITGFEVIESLSETDEYDFIFVFQQRIYLISFIYLALVPVRHIHFRQPLLQQSPAHLQ